MRVRGKGSQNKRASHANQKVCRKQKHENKPSRTRKERERKRECEKRKVVRRHTLELCQVMCCTAGLCVRCFYPLWKGCRVVRALALGGFLTFLSRVVHLRDWGYPSLKKKEKKKRHRDGYRRFNEVDLFSIFPSVVPAVPVSKARTGTGQNLIGKGTGQDGERETLKWILP